MIRAAGSAGDGPGGDPHQAWAKVRGLLDEQRAMKGPAGEPTRLGWSYAMGAAFKAGDMAAVIGVWDGMTEGEVRPFPENEVMVAAAQAAGVGEVGRGEKRDDWGWTR